MKAVLDNPERSRGDHHAAESSENNTASIILGDVPWMGNLRFHLLNMDRSAWCGSDHAGRLAVMVPLTV